MVHVEVASSTSTSSKYYLSEFRELQCLHNIRVPSINSILDLFGLQELILESMSHSYSV